jgi:hypothetical protein
MISECLTRRCSEPQRRPRLQVARRGAAVAELGSLAVIAPMKSLTPLFLCLLLVGCATDHQHYITPPQNDARSLESREDVIEVVFRHMCQPEPVEKDVSHNVNLAHHVYFLALGDSQDPSPEFLKRFADLKSPVKPISAGEWRAFFIYEKTTGERGAAFHVRSISMRSRDDCEVEVVIHPGGGLSASGPIYRITRKNGKWTVVGQRLKWIS